MKSTDELSMFIGTLKVLLLLLIGITFSALAEQDEERITLESSTPKKFGPESLPHVGCPASEEFKTVLTTLRKADDFKDNENRIRDIAFKVSLGCLGAAKRYFDAHEFLKKQELTGDQSMNLAIELAKKDDLYLQVFKEIFKRAIDPKQLALDIRGAVLLAQELSIYFEGDPSIALADFVNLTDFCSDPNEMALSKPRCIDIAIKVVKLTPLQKDIDYNIRKPAAIALSQTLKEDEIPKKELLALIEKRKEEISSAKSFIEAYKFMRSIGSHVGEALMISYDVVSISPFAVKNFIEGYKIGTDKAGLDLPARGSIQFAMEMARRTLPQGGETDLSRLPASESTIKKQRAIKTTEPKNQ